MTESLARPGDAGIRTKELLGDRTDAKVLLDSVSGDGDATHDVGTGEALGVRVGGQGGGILELVGGVRVEPGCGKDETAVRSPGELERNLAQVGAPSAARIRSIREGPVARSNRKRSVLAWFGRCGSTPEKVMNRPSRDGVGCELWAMPVLISVTLPPCHWRIRVEEPPVPVPVEQLGLRRERGKTCADECESSEEMPWTKRMFHAIILPAFAEEVTSARHFRPLFPNGCGGIPPRMLDIPFMFKQ
jgi:hypothetical protein